MIRPPTSILHTIENLGTLSGQFLLTRTPHVFHQILIIGVILIFSKTVKELHHTNVAHIHNLFERESRHKISEYLPSEDVRRRT